MRHDFEACDLREANDTARDLFYTYGKAKDQPRVYISPNTVFIQENNLKPVLHSAEFVDALFPVYRQKKSGQHRKISLLSTEFFLKWSNKKAVDLGMGDTCYQNFMLFTMYEFERNLYLFCFKGVYP